MFALRSSFGKSNIAAFCVFLLFFFFGVAPSRAELRCQAENFSTIADIGSIDLIKISKMTPVGTVVFQKSIDNLVVKCTSTGVGKKDNLYFIRKNLTNLLGAGSGLSVYVNYKGNRGDTPVNIPVAQDVGYYGPAGTSSLWPAINLGAVEVEIIKTGDSNGVITNPPKNVIAFTFDSLPSNGDPASYFIRNVPNIQYVTETCKPVSPSVMVNIPKEGVEDGGFGSAIGTVSKSEKDFSLDFVCDVDVSGKFNVSLQIDGTSAIPDTTKGVLSLDNSAKGDATGVGVQVLHGDTRAPVSLGVPWRIASYPLSVSGSLSVPLIARYYQTDAHVTPGKVHSSATFTLTYQ